MINPDAKLADVLSQTQEYLDLAVQAKNRREREFYKRIVVLHLLIARELEAMLHHQLSLQEGAR